MAERKVLDAGCAVRQAAQKGVDEAKAALAKVDGSGGFIDAATVGMLEPEVGGGWGSRRCCHCVGVWTRPELKAMVLLILSLVTSVCPVDLRLSPPIRPLLLWRSWRRQRLQRLAILPPFLPLLIPLASSLFLRPRPRRLTKRRRRRQRRPPGP